MAVPEGYKTVTCYLPPDIKAKLDQYCLDHEITRKDKEGNTNPSWGTGIVEVLKVFFSSDTIPSPLPDSGLSKEMVQGLVKDSLNSLLPNSVPSPLPTQEMIDSMVQESLTRILPSQIPREIPSKAQVKDLINDYLKSKLPDTVLSLLPDNLIDRQGVEEAVRRCLNAQSKISQEALIRLGELEKRLDSVAITTVEKLPPPQSEPQTEPEKTEVNEQLSSEDALEDGWNQNHDESPPTPPELLERQKEYDLLKEGLSQKELVERLIKKELAKGLIEKELVEKRKKTIQSSISQKTKKDRNTLEKWARKKDPDGFGWRGEKEDDKDPVYFPVL